RPISALAIIVLRSRMAISGHSRCVGIPTSPNHRVSNIPDRLDNPRCHRGISTFRTRALAARQPIRSRYRPAQLRDPEIHKWELANNAWTNDQSDDKLHTLALQPIRQGLVRASCRVRLDIARIKQDKSRRAAPISAARIGWAQAKSVTAQNQRRPEIYSRIRRRCAPAREGV